MKTSLSQVTRNVRIALAASAAVGMLASANTYAQEADEAEAKDFEQIAVVGTRAAPRSVGESPVPVDIISSDGRN